MPTRVHAIVLVSKLHKPTLRALAFAKATRPNVLEGVHVSTTSEEAGQLLEEWDMRNIDVPLKVLYSPYRELIRPIVDYATEIKQANPRGVVAVYIPEYVVGRWWEQLLHNQTALRLKGRLLFTPGVMVTSVPYQLRSSEIARERELREDRRVRPGDLRRGQVDDRGNEPAGPAVTRRPRPEAGAGAGRGSARRSTPWSARSRTAVTASSGCPSPSPGWSSSGTRSRGSGSPSRSPRAPRATGSGAATRSRCTSRRPTGSRRRASFSGPDACGGCDFQHVSLDRQRELKADVVREQLSRLAGLDVEVTVEAVPGRRRRACAGGPGSATCRSRRPARHAQAPLARRRPGRRLPDRRRPTPSYVVRDVAFDGRLRRVLAGPPGRARDAGRRRARRARRRSRGSRCSTSTPGSGCSRGSSPTRSGPAGWTLVEGDEAACEHAQRNVPSARRPGRRRRRGAGATAARARRPRRPRPAARGRQAGGRRADRRPGPRARSRTSPATRPRWPATSRPSPSTATACSRCAPSTCSR